MAKRPSHSQLEKYDINQKIIRQLANLESRNIIFTIKERAKTAEEIYFDTRIPLSTVYKHLHVLEDMALISMTKMEFSSSGKIMKFYKSRIKEAQISINQIKPKLILIPNI